VHWSVLAWDAFLFVFGQSFHSQKRFPQPKKRPTDRIEFPAAAAALLDGDRGRLTGSAWLVADTDVKRRR